MPRLIRYLVCRACGLTAVRRKRICCNDYYYACPVHGEVELFMKEQWR